MPGQGEFSFSNDPLQPHSYPSAFNKKDEHAQAGLYTVKLLRNNIQVSLSSTPRSGFHQYKFSQGNTAWLIIDLEHRDKTIQHQIHLDNNKSISGFRISQAWAKEQHVYFSAKTNLAVQSIQYNENKTKAILFFKLKKDKTLKVQLALSAVDVQGAQKNLNQEFTQWDLEKTVNQNQTQWNSMLSRIQIQTQDKKAKTIFYTALYHSLLAPNLYQDADGRYRGMDMKVHQGDLNNPRYTVFSLWDTYRTAHPLYELVYPEWNHAFVKTFLAMFEESGRLPVWELAANETYCMIGNHSIPVMANALINNKSDFSQDEINAIFNACYQTLVSKNFCSQDEYRNAFIACNQAGESVSKTIENSLDYDALEKIASIATNCSPEIKNNISIWKNNYKNLFNPESGFFQAKLNHQFIAGFKPDEVNQHYTEANAWQYLFGAHQDVKGMFQAMAYNAQKANGFDEEKIKSKLDQLFYGSSAMSGRDQSDITGLIGQYAHGNEPSHHMAYLYQFINYPYETQKILKKIMTELYTDQPDGLCGNEDCGQMSAWYILSALGVYPVNPNDTEWICGLPLFDAAEINVPNKKSIRFSSNKMNGSDYMIAVQKNNVKQSSNFNFTYGDQIEFIFDQDFNNNQIQYKWKSQEIKHESFIPMAYISKGESVFKDETKVELSIPKFDLNEYKIMVSLNKLDKEFSEYKSPILINQNSTLYFKTCRTNINECNSTQKAFFAKTPRGWHITMKTKYANQYRANGDFSLFDGMKGSNDFRDGFWLGFQGRDVEIELNSDSTINTNSMTLRFLQDQKSWILLPKAITVWQGFSPNQLDNMMSEPIPAIGQSEEIKIYEHRFAIDLTKGKFFKIRINNGGKLGEWHAGAGSDSWIFTDEIIFE